MKLGEIDRSLKHGHGERHANEDNLAVHSLWHMASCLAQFRDAMYSISIA